MGILEVTEAFNDMIANADSKAYLFVHDLSLHPPCSNLAPLNTVIMLV